MRCRRRRFHWGILSSAGAAWPDAGTLQEGKSTETEMKNGADAEENETEF